MKTIIKREEILEYLTILNAENAYEILKKLENATDLEGKNPLIIALEEELYYQFLIMIKPIPYKNKNSKLSYYQFFDPFNNGVFNNLVPLKWDIDDNVYPEESNNYHNIWQTRVNFYSLYSPYNYILHLKDEDIKKSLIDACHYIDFDIINTMPIANIPLKDEYNNLVIYTEEDYIRYIPYHLIEAIKALYERNIPISKYTFNKKYTTIYLNSSDLTEDNIEILRFYSKGNTISEQYGYICINIKHNQNELIGDISEKIATMLSQLNYQIPKHGFISVDEYYQKVLRLYRMLKIPYKEDMTIDEIIEFCINTNSYLCVSEDKNLFFYHPKIKEKLEPQLLKK